MKLPFNFFALKTVKTFSISMLATVFLLGATAGEAGVKIYKWTEANGTPHYSQNPPTNGVNLKKVQEIELRDGGRVASAGQMAGKTSADPTTAADANMTPEQKRIKELEAQNKAQADQQNKERCKSLQNNLQNLNAGGRVYEMDNNGERKYLDNREMELRKQKVAEAVQQYCQS